MPKRPLHAGADLVVVVRVREHPLRGALEHGEALDVRARSSGAIWKPLAPAPIMATRLPCRSTEWSHCAGVECRPGEVLLPVDRLGVCGRFELPHRADHRTRRQCLSSLRCGRGRERSTWRSSSSQDASVTSVSHSTWRPMSCLSITRLEVRLQLGLFGEEVRPLIGRLEAVAVEVVADVDPRAGIGVLVPGPADAGVLLDDRERDAGLLEPDARQQSRLPAADDDDREVVGGRAPRPHEPCVAAVELHLLEQHRHVLVGYRLADQPLHHLAAAARRRSARVPGSRGRGSRR